MELTVCICTHNRPSYVQDCLAGLRCQTAGHDAFAVLLVDSGSTGDTPAALQKLAAGVPGARLIRLDRSGVSAARNVGAVAAGTPFIAYIDDDAIPAADWIERILAALRESTRPPALIGGRILPSWKAPLPPWWPQRLRGVLSIIECEGCGEYRSQSLPPGLEPYAANMVVHIPSLKSVGWFSERCGRSGSNLLSDEEVLLAWQLQDAGYSARYDSRIVVQHQIQAERLTPHWLLDRLYWQGASTVLTRRALGAGFHVWWELPRRLAVATLFMPALLLSPRSARLIGCRWRRAYAAGFIRAAIGWRCADSRTIAARDQAVAEGQAEQP